MGWGRRGGVRDACLIGGLRPHHHSGRQRRAESRAHGTLEINGTANNRAVFEGITSRSNAPVAFNHVEVTNGSGNGVVVQGGTLTLDGVESHNNRYGVQSNCPPTRGSSTHWSTRTPRTASTSSAARAARTRPSCTAPRSTPIEAERFLGRMVSVPTIEA